MLQRAVAYYRVSTQRQGRSGLGIDAQRNTVERFAEAEELELIGDVRRDRDRQGIGRPRPAPSPRRSAVARPTRTLLR